MRPCLWCATDESRLYDGVAASLASLPWKLNTAEVYRNSCTICETYVVVSKAEYLQIKRILHFDRRAAGNRGRCLNEDVHVGGKQLRQGDRLEPFDGMPDVMEFDKITNFPTLLLFWRCGNEVIARHRNPLFRDIDPYDVLIIDILHGLHLGPIQTLVKTAFHTILVSGLWGLEKPRWTSGSK